MRGHAAWCLKKIGGECDCGFVAKSAPAKREARVAAKTARGDRCSILCVLEDGHRGKCKTAEQVEKAHVTTDRCRSEGCSECRTESVPHEANDRLDAMRAADTADGRRERWVPLPRCRCGPGGTAIHNQITKDQCKEA